MPKEVIKETSQGKSPQIEVRWGTFQNHVAIHINRHLDIQLLNKAGKPIDGFTYEDLVFNFDSDKQMKRFIKALKKARRKTFK